MSDSRINESEVLIASIIEKVASGGVRTTTLSAMDFAVDPVSGSDINHFDEAIRWLRDEGFIRYQKSNVMSDTDDDRILHYPATLTAFGFSILSSRLTDGLLVGEAIRSAASTQSGLSKAGELTGSLLGGLVKTLST